MICGQLVFVFPCPCFIIFVCSTRCIALRINYELVGTKQSRVCWLDWTDKAKANPCYRVSMNLCGIWIYLCYLCYFGYFVTVQIIWNSLDLFLSCCSNYLYKDVAQRKFELHCCQLIYTIFTFESIILISGLQEDQSHWSTVYFTPENFTKYVKAKSSFPKGSKLQKMHLRKRIWVLPLVVVDHRHQLQLLTMGLDLKNKVQTGAENRRSNLVPKIQGISPELEEQIKTMEMAWTVGV